MPIKLPSNSQRITVIGRTGTGKTVAGLWHLSNNSFQIPWIVLNFKSDEQLDAIEKAQHVPLDFTPGKKDTTGIFIYHPHPDDTEGTRGDKSAVDRLLMRIWERGNCGVFVDEAFVLGYSSALNTCLTQGRSLHIPMICCTQKPAWISRFAFSEADFFQVFALNDDRDKSTVGGFTPIEVQDFERLKKYQSFYYNVADDEMVRLAPVPSPKETLKTIDAKLPRRLVRI